MRPPAAQPPLTGTGAPRALHTWPPTSHPHATPPHKQKARLAKQKGGKGGRSYEEDDRPADAPRQWTDYTVKFEFPEPTELPPPLLQVCAAAPKKGGGRVAGLFPAPAVPAGFRLPPAC